MWVAQGMQDPDHNMPYLLQGGLGLPDRDYYVSPSPKMAALRKAYGQHVVAVLGLMGVADASRRAAAIVDLETRMAAVHATRVQSADVSLPQVWTREALAAKAPGLDWPALLEAAGLQGAPAFTVWHPAAVTGLAALAGSAPLAAWKDWLAFHTVNTRTGFLPKAFVDEGFAFYGKTLNGTPAPRPRWQRGVDATSLALGEVVGRVYVERHFPPEAKAKVRAMVDDLTRAFSRRVDALTWMTPETKARAKAKVSTLYVGVGYPDKWIDYGPLQIAKDDAIGNVERAELFEYRRQLAKLGKPVDRTRMVDDAADGERGQPAAAERDELPRRHPAAAVLRSGAATPPRTTAPSARPSATRSATASTTSAASSTPRAGSPTGGRRRISSTSRRPARRWRRSTTPTGRSRTWRSTGTRCSARTSPISPAWPPPTTPIACR